MSTTGAVIAAISTPATESGLALDLPSRLLDQEFGRGRVARFEDVDFPVTLTHEPTRRFLRETGLPADEVLFSLDTDLPLPTLTEFYSDEEYTGGFPLDRLPRDADQLIRLGRLAGDAGLVVDGTSGEILRWTEPQARLDPLNRDVSELVLALCLLRTNNSEAMTGLEAVAGIEPA
ncbi:SUKH-4 family immunity protein [Streptomyces sp. NPDC003362]